MILVQARLRLSHTDANDQIWTRPWRDWKNLQLLLGAVGHEPIPKMPCARILCFQCQSPTRCIAFENFASHRASCRSVRREMLRLRKKPSTDETFQQACCNKLLRFRSPIAPFKFRDVLSCTASAHVRMSSSSSPSRLQTKRI